MQEEVENRTVTLMISTTKLTGRVLKEALSKYLAWQKTKAAGKTKTVAEKQQGPVIPHGKQTVRQLIGQNQGVTNIEINDGNIRDFERVARKYGVDYAIKKDKTGELPKYLVFFKSRDGDALQAAFQEYTAAVLKKKPSVIRKLREAVPLQKEQAPNKVRNKEKELER